MLTTVKLYATGAVIILVLLLVGFAGWEYDQRKLDAEKLDKLSGVVNTQAETIRTVQVGQAADSAAINAVAASQASISLHGTTVRQRVQTLRSNDNAMRVYLDTALPPNGCLLDDTCPAGNGASAAIGGAASAVHAP